MAEYYSIVYTYHMFFIHLSVDDREGWEASEGGDICIIMAYLHFCMAETNTTL